MLTTATSHLATRCDFCEQSLPPGCGHEYGHSKDCRLGPATDPKRIVGLAILKAMEGRHHIAWELNNRCDEDIRLEVIDELGQAAIDAAAKLKE